MGMKVEIIASMCTDKISVLSGAVGDQVKVTVGLRRKEREKKEAHIIH